MFPFEQMLSRSRIVAEDPTCGVSSLIYSQGLYDHDNMHLIRRMLRADDVFFDVGANIGSYTLLASESDAQVFAFEPHPRTFRQLQRNIALNRRRNATAFELAFGDRDGIGYLAQHAHGSINHLVEKPAEHALPVLLARADRFCRQHDVRPRFVKVDVEGFEYEVLAGFGDALRSIDVLFVEINGLSDARHRGYRAIHQLLDAAGLAGPFRYDADSHALSRTQPRKDQDCVYVSRSFDLASRDVASR